MATISRIIKFTPTIGGNDKRPDTDPEKFHVELRAINVGRKQSQLRKFVEMDPKKLMKEMMSENQQNEVRQMLEEQFVGFINMFFKDVASDDDEAKGLSSWPMDEATGGREEQKRPIKAGERYFRLMTMQDMFEVGEFELAMEIFMHLIGSSQLKRSVPPKTDAGGNLIPPTAGEEREDEEKNSESLSGITPIH